MKLGELTNSRNNNLDALRLIAAFFVLFSHSFPSWGMPQPLFPFYTSNGLIGLGIFFIISGFLITKSFVNRPLGEFFKARILRIFPALIFVVLISVFVIGLSTTNLSTEEYLSDGGTYQYLLNATLIDFVPHLPGVFVDRYINISLWTLQYEFLLYLVVALIGIIGILKKRVLALGLFILCNILVFFDFPADFDAVPAFSFSRITWLALYFTAGMTAYLYREHILLKPQIFILLLLTLIPGSLMGGLSDNAWVLILTYIVFFIGYYPKINLRWLTQYGDFSYGFYLWSSIGLNLIWLAYGSHINPYLSFIAAGCFSYIMGAISWHLIEKKALTLKDKSFPAVKFNRLVFKQKPT